MRLELGNGKYKRGARWKIGTTGLATKVTHGRNGSLAPFASTENKNAGMLISARPDLAASRAAVFRASCCAFRSAVRSRVGIEPAIVGVNCCF